MKKIVERDTKKYICNPCLEELPFYTKKNFSSKALRIREKKKGAKKYEKKWQKYLEGNIKTLYLCTRFPDRTGATRAREANRTLKK